MAKAKFLDVDRSKGYPKIVDVLNQVFEKKNQKGEDLKAAQKSVWNIKDGKKAWFIYLAVQEKGYWKQPNEKINWINIPSQDQKVITQIPLIKPVGDDPVKDGEYAVFVCTETKEEKYRFFGIFRCIQIKNNGICIWERKSPTLDTEEWKAEE